MKKVIITLLLAIMFLPVYANGSKEETEKTDEPRITKPDEDVVSESLLSKIKTELPGKVKEATKIEDEE